MNRRFRNTFKKSMAFLLSLIMFISVTLNEGIVRKTYAEDNVITRAEWLNKLAETFDISIDESNCPDNYFSDIDNETTYYDDIMKAVSYGVVDIEAGKEFKPAEPATREFAAQTLNACLGYQLEEDSSYTFTDSSDCKYADDDQIAVNKGWFALVNGKFMPDNQITASESEKMINAATTEINKLEVSADYDSVWNVADGVKTVPAYVETTIDNNVLTITNSPVTINNDDIFVVYQGEIAVPYKAVSVSKTGNQTVITIADVDEYDSAFSEVDAEGIIESDELTFTSLDGTELEIEMEDEPIAQSYSMRLAPLSSTKKIKDVNFKKSFNTSGNTTSTINGTFSNIRVKYNISTGSKESFVQVEGDLTMTGSIEAAYKQSINIMQIGIAGIGGVTLTIDINAAAKMKSTITTHILAGVSYSGSDGFRTIRSFKENGGSNTSVEGTASIGATLKCGITELKFLSGYVYGKAGITAKFEDTAWTDGEPRNCKTFLAYMYASYGVEASCKLINFKYSKKIDIYTLDNSPLRVYHHYEDGKPVAECTRGMTFEYFTKYYSSYWNTGWAGCDSSYGLDDAGQPFAIYEYDVKKDDSNNEYAVITKYRGNMRNLTIPETLDGYEVRGIGNSAFSGYTNLLYVNVPDTVTDIGIDAFSGCRNLLEIKLPKSLEKLGGEAFENCVSLSSIEIPKSLSETYFYNGCVWVGGIFKGCDNLKNITFEQGTTVIVERLFEENLGIERVVIPDTVTEIRMGAFRGCINLVHVDIPESVTEIGISVFSNCTSLSEVSLPKSLIKIGGEAFYNCVSLTSVEIPKSLSETYFYNGRGWVGGIFKGCDNLKNITFEQGTTTIVERLFEENLGIERVVIPDTVTEIRMGAFRGCINLVHVDIPESVTEIGISVFSNCTSLSEVSLPKSLIKIGGEAFYNCVSLTSVEIPKSLSETYFYNGIGYVDGVFKECNNLKSITFEQGISRIIDFLFMDNAGIENITIPDTVTEIGSRAFENCINLKSIKLPSELQTIGYYAFNNALELERIEIPDTVTDIGVNCFNNCTSLSYVKLPDNEESINKYMFYGCKSLKTITLPDTVKQINESAFEGSGLTNIKMSPNVTIIEENAFSNTPLENIEFSGKETAICMNAFKNCDSLKSVSIPNSVTHIGIGIFQDCDALYDVKLGSGITVIPANAFEHCDSLTQILIPYRVEKIIDNAFANCTKFTEITIPRGTAEIGSNAFSYPTKTTVYGIEGTYAETYANEKGMQFVNKEVKASQVTLSETNLSMNVGEEKVLTIDIAPINFTDEVDWKSTDTNVVTVDKYGNIEAMGIGTATIKVTVGSLSTICKVTVVQPVWNIWLSDYNLELENGEVYQLAVDISPSNANNKQIVWSSSNSKVATVDQNGNITAIGKGNTIITATAQDGGGAKAECEVIVTNNSYIVTDVSKMESGHPYDNNCKDIWTYSIKDAKVLEVTFDEKTEMEEGFDNLIILDANNKQIGTYTGKQLAGKTITVAGDTVKIKLDTDNGGSAYGFKVSSITAKDKPVGVKGDANGDGNMDIKDSAIIKRYLAGWDVEIDMTAADMDGDGKVTIKDSALIKRQLAGWE